jgi:hypothetical protein
MDRALTVVAPIPHSLAAAAASRFAGDPGAWLADDARRLLDAWQAEVRLGRLRQPVVATVGSAWVDGPTTWRTLRWTPVRLGEGHEQVDDRRLPAFEGRIGLRLDAEGAAADRADLVLAGTYEPPAGRLGSVLDALLLHKVAEVTAHQLVTDVADRLTRPDPGLLVAAAAAPPDAGTTDRS